MKTNREIKFTPVQNRYPEYGMECVVIMNGNSVANALFGYDGKFYNDSSVYDSFPHNEVTHWVETVDLFDNLPKEDLYTTPELLK